MALRRSIHVRKFLRLARRYVTGLFEPGRFTAPEVPRLSIETTNVCDAKCGFCANGVMQRRRQPLTMERFAKAVDDFVRLGGVMLDLNVTIGEPLLDPYLLERARYLKRYPHLQGVGFVTTLQWLQRFDLDEFFEAGFQWIAVSTTLSGRQPYAEFFGVDRYEQVIANLTTLLTENRRRGNPLSIAVALKPTNEPVAAVVGHPDFQRISMLAGDLVPQASEIGLYVDDWLGAVTLPAYLKRRPLIPRPFRPCRLLYAGLIVYSNGRIGACACRDFEASSELILGHVDEHALGDLWRGDTLARLRSEWRTRNRVPDICRVCRHYVC